MDPEPLGNFWDLGLSNNLGSKDTGEHNEDKFKVSKEVNIIEVVARSVGGVNEDKGIINDGNNCQVPQDLIIGSNTLDWLREGSPGIEVIRGDKEEDVNKVGDHCVDSDCGVINCKNGDIAELEGQRFVKIVDCAVEIGHEYCPFCLLSQHEEVNCLQIVLQGLFPSMEVFCFSVVFLESVYFFFIHVLRYSYLPSRPSCCDMGS